VDAATGRVAGYKGARRAADHADRNDPLWSKVAWVRFLEFLVLKGKGATFVAEEAWKWCEARRLLAPPDRRGYGTLTREAARKGLIADTKERPRAGSHGREVVLWKVL
jgi:hypothetical protein